MTQFLTLIGRCDFWHFTYVRTLVLQFLTLYQFTSLDRDGIHTVPVKEPKCGYFWLWTCLQTWIMKFLLCTGSKPWCCNFGPRITLQAWNKVTYILVCEPKCSYFCLHICLWAMVMWFLTLYLFTSLSDMILTLCLFARLDDGIFDLVPVYRLGIRWHTHLFTSVVIFYFVPVASMGGSIFEHLPVCKHGWCNFWLYTYCICKPGWCDFRPCICSRTWMICFFIYHVFVCLNDVIFDNVPVYESFLTLYLLYL